MQAVEAARTVEDRVITDPREADVGSILGFGFAPYTGGTLSYIDFMGAKNFVALCHKLEAKYGSRFTPPKLLEEMAAKGETFYGRFAPKKAAAAAVSTSPHARGEVAGAAGRVRGMALSPCEPRIIGDATAVTSSNAFADAHIGLTGLLRDPSPRACGNCTAHYAALIKPSASIASFTFGRAPTRSK